jgi:hypothetical protein
MNAPLSPSPQVDVGEAFGFVFRSPNWFGKLAVGALCLLFFWALLIPVFILLGYFVETARVVSQGGRELPPWTDIGKKLGDGFMLAVVLFIWGLPGSILSGGSWNFSNCTGSSCTSFYTPSPLAPLGALYGLLLALLTAAIWSQFIEGGFGAAFDFRVIFRRATRYPGITVTVWLIASIVAAISGFAGFIVILSGALFTFPYAFAISANMYGQFKQVTESAATAPAG